MQEEVLQVKQKMANQILQGKTTPQTKCITLVLYNPDYIQI